MNENIKDKYNISFYNRVVHFESWGKEVSKTLDVNNEYLGMFLICWDSVSEINDSLLPDIEEALANPKLEVNSGSPPVDIVMSEGLVDFYGYKGYANSIPLQEFKKLIIGQL